MSFKSGNIIIECKPLVHVLNETEKSIRCDFCFELK